LTRLEHSDGDDDADARAAQAFVEQIDAAIQNPTPKAADELDALDVDSSLLRALTEYEEHRLRENIRRGRHISLVDSTFEISAFEEGLSELSRAVREAHVNEEAANKIQAATRELIAHSDSQREKSERFRV
jgi:two-component system chemotaxis sensor kinase CheA